MVRMGPFGRRVDRTLTGYVSGPSQHPVPPQRQPLAWVLGPLGGVQDSALWRPQSLALCCPRPAGLWGPGGSLGTLAHLVSNLCANCPSPPAALSQFRGTSGR